MTTVLDDRALNRATLARQLLLDRSASTVLDAVTHLCGLQAQEPQAPFVGLWSRLREFDPAALSGLLTGREVVRAHLMRRTVHLVSAADALAWRGRHDAMLRQRVLGVYRDDLDGVDLAALADTARAVLADETPRSARELTDAVLERAPSLREVATRALGEVLVAALVPTVQVPPRGLWRTGGGARYRPLASWLDGEPTPTTPTTDDEVGAQLVRRYLAAYGPAATADVRAWSGLAGLPGAVAAIRDELVTFRDRRGRELLDLPGAPRPDPGTPAPVRFLPEFDNAVLGYDDRSRIIDPVHRGLSVAGARVVLVDGRVAATWTVGDGGAVHVAQLRRFTRAERTEVGDEARALATWLSGGRRGRARLSRVAATA